MYSLLFSEDVEAVQRGIDRVSAWRIRGKVPIGVDITSSLIEACLRCAQLFILGFMACLAVQVVHPDIKGLLHF